jgi:hypothetical protein
MKILFLDHQGVIHFKPVVWPTGNPELRNFDPESIKILNKIIEETDCEIVVSSDWKTWVDLPRMQSFYIQQGIIKSPIGYTPNLEFSGDIALSRSKEILAWLKFKGEVSTWVAVDDLDMRSHLERFVFVEDVETGIKSNLIYNSIIKFLS